MEQLVPADATRERRRPVVVDLFAGAGGLSLGFERAGFDVLAAVEYDPVHAATHAYNFPLTAVLCQDVRSLNARDLLEASKKGWASHYPGTDWDLKVDVLIGGPSCQGFSSIGKRAIDDSRNELVGQFVRLVEELRPRAFCMENVPGFLTGQYQTLREDAFSRLRKAGYRLSGENLVLRAEDFGVPQKRRRVVVLGIRNDVSTVPVRVAVSERPISTVQDAFALLPAVEHSPQLVNTDVLDLDQGLINARLQNENAYLELSGALRSNDDSYGHRREVDQSYLSGCRMTVHSETSRARFASTKSGTKEPVSRLFKLAADQPSLTLRAGTGRERGAFSAPRPLHPTLPRVITAREAARLHSFPDWFRFHTTNWHAHRQIGNAVPPLLAQAVAAALMSALGLRARKSSLAGMVFGPKELLALSPSAAADAFAVPLDQIPKRRRKDPVLPEDMIVGLA